MTSVEEKVLARLEACTAGWPQALARADYEQLQESLSYYNTTLLAFLSERTISDLPATQQQRLHGLLLQQKAFADEISASKQDAARQLAGLRQGKNLASTYTANPP